MPDKGYWNQVREIMECTGDFFSFLAEEASEVFGEAKNRLHEAAKDNAWDDEEW